MVQQVNPCQPAVKGRQAGFVDQPVPAGCGAYLTACGADGVVDPVIPEHGLLWRSQWERFSPRVAPRTTRWHSSLRVGTAVRAPAPMPAGMPRRDLHRAGRVARGLAASPAPAVPPAVLTGRGA